jgi:hypothetical protein
MMYQPFANMARQQYACDGTETERNRQRTHDERKATLAQADYTLERFDAFQSASIRAVEP